MISSGVENPLENVVTPATTKPFSIVTAPVPAVSEILSTLIRPPDPPPRVPNSFNPNTSGTKSSPSAIIKSALSSILMSLKRVYAASADAG